MECTVACVVIVARFGGSVIGSSRCRMKYRNSGIIGTDTKNNASFQILDYIFHNEELPERLALLQTNSFRPLNYLKSCR